MANTQYTLFGQKFSKSQGAMMTHVFEELLNRHPERMMEAVERFTCLTMADLSVNLEALRTAPNAFLNKRIITVEGQQVYIGTSYNLRRKLSLISQLFKLLGEAEQQFSLEQQEETFISDTREIKKAPKTASAQISYWIFGKKYRSTQAEMMYRVFEEVLTQNPDLVDWAADNLSCVSMVNYTDSKNRSSAMPSAFQSCRIMKVDGKLLCIGSAFNLKAKQTLIDKLLEHANLPAEVFKIDKIVSLPKLMPWQKEAAQSVLSRVNELYGEDRRLGLICQPAGTGKSFVLSEIIRLLLEKHEQVQSVLVLTSRAGLAEQFKDRLDELSGNSYTVELADSVSKLMRTVGKSNTVVVATAQKLLLKNTDSNNRFERDKIEIFSQSDKLLVVVEEATFNYFSRTYQDMYARFPNAMFIGMTNDPEPSERFIRYFGPLIYRYTYEQAVHDGFLNKVEYESVELISANSEDNVFSSVRYSLDRLHKLAEFIAMRKKEQSGCTLVLCENQESAITLYNCFLPLMKKDKLRLSVTSFYRDAFKGSTNARIDAIWNGEYFDGLVIACTASAINSIYDTVYLDKKLTKSELLSVLSMLSRKSEKRKKTGTLVDVRNNWDMISRWFPEGLPMITEKSSASANIAPLNELIKQLSDALKSRNFNGVKEILSHISENFPEKGKNLSEQLEFLFPENIKTEQFSRYWQQHTEELAWKCDLWCALSVDSDCGWDKPEDSGEEDINALQDEEETIVSPLPAIGTSQERGALLEQQTKQLIRELFDLSTDYTLDELRLQTSGNQYGFDIRFEYTDTYGANCVCMIECKNYRNEIPHREVVDKLSELRTNNVEVDHWILISPYSQMSNKLAQQYEIWQKQDMWGSVRNAQIWTPDNMVQELFGLFKYIYAELYDVGDDDPAEWCEEKRQRILAHWKAKIAPVPRVPQSWKAYVKTPACLLTQHEADLTTVREYDALYQHRVTTHLLDENEIPIEGTAEEYFLKWLNAPDNPVALLLGDFGDGKSFFTYTLARRLCKAFSRSPKVGWIPLRLSLRDISNVPFDFRQFLEQRLKEFSADMGEWNTVNREHSFLIILDGFDEMSQGMNDTAVLDNLFQLERIMEQFRGHKILVTSRKNVIYSDSIRERIISSLGRPEIVHLAPVSRKDGIRFLEQLADTQKKKDRLYKIRNTHDLLGLASKPLFLNMMREQLENDNISQMDMSEIYRDYAKRVLLRKYSNQWAMEHNYTDREVVCDRLLVLLEKLAICLQYEGKESISLGGFKTYVNQDNLAQLLWDSIDADSCDTAEDADKRVTNRSLLKYDKNHPENRSFCHRSMKEYFVAVGTVRLLLENENEASAFLKTGRLGYEILDFAGNAVKKLPKAQQDLLGERLTALVFESRGKQEHPKKQQYSTLSANCVGLLHYSGIGLVGDDWSGLLLDNAVLSGEDLSYKNLSFNSMQYARLDNADLTGCDLRGCDFTGVRFEKSGQLVSFAVEPRETALLACYRDGKLRKWETRTGDTKTVAVLPQEKQLRLMLGGDRKEGVASAEGFRFWQRGSDKVDFAGYVALRHGMRLLDFCDNTVLLEHSRGLYLLNLADNTIIYRREIAGQYKACLLSDNTIVLWSEENSLELIDTANNELYGTVIPYRQAVDTLCTTARSGQTGIIVVSSSETQFNSFRVTKAQNDWVITPDITGFDCGEKILALDVDDAGGIYVGTASGTIKQYFFNHTGSVEDERSYRLELKCRGAKIEGVRPKEQYDVLKKAISGNSQ